MSDANGDRRQDDDRVTLTLTRAQAATLRLAVLDARESLGQTMAKGSLLVQHDARLRRDELTELGSELARQVARLEEEADPLRHYGPNENAKAFDRLAADVAAAPVFDCLPIDSPSNP